VEWKMGGIVLSADGIGMVPSSDKQWLIQLFGSIANLSASVSMIVYGKWQL
jgi:hypothetical protein